jgi:hypothetical protein
MDTRLYFLKDPIVLIGILLLGTVYYFGRNSVEGKMEITETEIQQETDMDKTEMQETDIQKSKTDKTDTQYKTDTTEWRKSYYNHLYWSK